ncbi:hypothetical protein BLOT_002455 [Blomia tropicalis]|nr:hypothetical protein BLOT_002455 [Blomia tropicalis]
MEIHLWANNLQVNLCNIDEMLLQECSPEGVMILLSLIFGVLIGSVYTKSKRSRFMKPIQAHDCLYH